MTDEYAFDQSTYAIPMESRVLVSDPHSVWQSDEHSEHFSNSAETTLSESYMTAGDNTTQYFSVLETSTETILNDISQISLDCTRVGNELTLEAAPHEQQVIGEENQEVVLFRVDGSDELYGIQIAQDEEGNLQKYQFQVCQNADGQLETLPETIQLVPFSADENLQENLALETAETEQHEELPTRIPEEVFIKQEMLNEEEATTASVESHVEGEIETEEHIIEMEEDTKEGILRSALEGSNIYQEQEYPQEPEEDQGQNEEYYEEEEENEIQQEEEDEEEQIIYHQVYIDEPETSEGEFLEEINTEEEIYQPEESEMQGNVQMYLSESDNFQFESDNSCMNDESLNEDSEEGTDELHITGQDDLEEYEGYKQILEDDHNIIKVKLPGGHTHFEAIEAPLKNKNRIVKASGDKNTCAIIINDEKENVGTKFHTIRKTNPRSILKTSVISIEEKPEYEKRFAKGKIAVQARQFQNYISQTKILEAPVRQERLPRKQQIKPLKRSGEEIVVQEVVVSSNGFIETRVDGVVRERKPLVPTECIQLSDSDDSSCNRKRKRRSKKNKQVEIVISDSEDESNVINITKVEHKCIKCPKTFPSLGSLKTHMQYHNFAESKEMKYKCTQCDESFKNNALLTRHLNLHKTNSKIECGICKKLFSDRNQLQLHKRTHVKDHMFKNTTIERVSPKKVKPVKTDIHKCKDCGKVFTTFVLLNSHMLTHKKFLCTTCPLSFSSRILLDNHRVRNCVKKSPKKKISFVPRRSYMPRLSTRRLSFKAPPPPKTLTIQVNCDSCDAGFNSHKSLFEHKVLKHGLNTPDKMVGKENQRKSMYRQRTEHCGIPAGKKLKEAFAGLKSKLGK